MLVGFLGLSK